MKEEKKCVHNGGNNYADEIWEEIEGVALGK